MEQRVIDDRICTDVSMAVFKLQEDSFNIHCDAN